MIPLLLTVLARAADVPLPESLDPRFGLGAGVEGVVNDPFLHRNGVRMGGHLALRPWVELGAALVWFPILGTGGEEDPDWKPLTKTLLEELSITPDVSKVWAEGQLTLAIFPLESRVGPARTRIGLAAGYGAFATQDDLVAIGGQDVPQAQATAEQVHGGPVVGLLGDVQLKGLTVRVRWERFEYIETVSSTTLEDKYNVVVGAEVIGWLP